MGARTGVEEGLGLWTSEKVRRTGSMGGSSLFMCDADVKSGASERVRRTGSIDGAGAVVGRFSLGSSKKARPATRVSECCPGDDAES